jgi:ferredoxin-NADP reductase
LEKQSSQRRDSDAQFFSTELLSRKWLSPKVFEIELRRPERLHFKPGQTLCFIYRSEERYYSFVSSPDDPTIVLCVRYVETGFFSPILASAGIGTSFDFTGPHGYFIFTPSPRAPIFIATGTGVAPFVSMAGAGVKDYTLLHGVSDVPDLYYKNRLAASAKKHVPCLSASTETLAPDAYFRGRVTEFLMQNLPPAVYDFYLCGRQDMIRDVMHLVDRRFPGSLVYYEVFY